MSVAVIDVNDLEAPLIDHVGRQPERIRFKGRVSLVEKDGVLFARATYRHDGKRKQVWQKVVGGDWDHASGRVVEKIEKILNSQPKVRWIYLIHLRGTDFYKIGITSNVERRLSNLQNANPMELVLVTKIPGDDELEMVFHETFRRHRIRGEWFRFQSITKLIVTFQKHSTDSVLGKYAWNSK